MTLFFFFFFEGHALKALDSDTLGHGFQSDDSKNPMIGIPSRCQLLVKLGESLVDKPEIFGQDARPGNLVGESSKKKKK